MATETTTLRLSKELRDEIAKLAEESGTSMAELVAHAIEQLKRQRWWDGVQSSLSELDSEYASEASILDAASGDGLGH